MLTTPVTDLRKQSFEEAWAYIRSETAKIRMPSACGSCEYKDVCGVCAAVCFTETGHFDQVPTYICEKTKEQVRITQEVYAERSKA